MSKLSGMRILVTNEQLDQRPGADLFVRDLARALQRRGHFVIAYSSDPRHQTRLLERDLVAVATDLDRLPFRPDVIHARHHLDAMSALIALPDVPAIFDCLGPGSRTMVPVHPRLHRYIVPSSAVARPIEAECVPPGMIAASSDGVDLERFARVRPAPAGLARLAVYDDHLDRRDESVMAIEAAAGAGTIDFIGRRFGRSVDNPEQRLPDYDVVFARERKAIEAMACGCAVVLVGEHACGDLVSTASFQEARHDGFAPPLAAPAASPDAIRESLARYSAADCAAVTAEVRRSLGFDALADRYEAAYHEAIAANQSAAVPWADEQVVVSRYLRRLSLAFKAMDSEQKRSGDVPLNTAMTLLDVVAGLSAIQADLDRPHWWPDQRPA